MARSFVYTWQYKINWPEGDNLRIAPFFVLPVDALGVHSNRQRPPGGDTFSLYLNLPGGVENVALLFGLFIIFILNIMTHIFLSMFLQFELFVLPLLPQLKGTVPWMSGLVNGLQNRPRRFESARNLKRKESGIC